uniref:Uncharacterized protein n=1 Tax=Anguilla anguilla TaxID=7936 RepID=A0A0E9W951_ANGAN
MHVLQSLAVSLFKKQTNKTKKPQNQLLILYG